MSHLSFREGVTRSDLGLKDPGLAILSSSTTATSSKYLSFFHICLAYFLSPITKRLYLKLYFLKLCRELLTGEKEGLLQLATDKSLLNDPVFRPLVEKYAAVSIYHLYFI